MYIYVMKKYYIIPSNKFDSTNYYIQHGWESWEQTDKLDFNTATVVVFEDKKTFRVVYQGKYYHIHGSNVGFVPLPLIGRGLKDFLRFQTVKDNRYPFKERTLYTVGDYTSKYENSLIITVKQNLLKKAGIELPFGFGWSREYEYAIDGITIGVLDAIGMKSLPVNILESLPKVNNRKLLTMG